MDEAEERQEEEPEAVRVLRQRVVELEAEVAALRDWKRRQIREDSSAMFSRRPRGDDR